MTTRRSFIAGSLTLGGASFLALNGWSDALAQCVPTPLRTTTYKVRPEINSLAPNHPIIVAYKKAIAAMRALPATHLHSWQYQANIHVNFCPHGNWFFLPWHRAYLNYYEQIIRKLSGYSKFVLPYWDWSKNPQVPAAFWGLDNPLTVERAIGMNDTLPVDLVGPQVMAQIMAVQDFQQFGSYATPAPRGGPAMYGALEGTPHNGVHNAIGGLMSDMLSPMDPLFWLHHANVDRLWALWNASGRQNSTNVAWTGYMFNKNFASADRKLINVGVCNLLSTYQLGYRYDDQPLPTLSSRRSLKRTSSLLRAESLKRTKRRAKKISKNLKRVSEQEILELFRATPLPQGILPPGALPTVSPTLDLPSVRVGVKTKGMPKVQRSYIRIFVGAEDISPTTPTSDPHYVGSIAVFGGDHEHEHHHAEEHSLSGEFYLDLNVALEKLKRTDSLPTENIPVRLIAVPIGGAEEGEILEGEASFSIAR